MALTTLTKFARSPSLWSLLEPSNDYVIHNKPLDDVSLSNAQYIVARAFAPISKILNFTKQMVTDQTQYILLKGKTYLEELNLVSSKNFKWKDFPSITSDESRIIVLQAK